MALPPELGVSLTVEEYEDRFTALHKQLYATTEFAYNDVCELVYSPPSGRHHSDHAVIHDGENWHDLYNTGDMRFFEAFAAAHARREHEKAPQLQAVFEGIGHAVGPTLFDLKYQETISFPSQGRFDLWYRQHPALFRCERRWGMVYQVLGRGDPGFTAGLSLAWSDDLWHWEPHPDNPIIVAPQWASTLVPTPIRDPFVVCVDGVYLIYSIVYDMHGDSAMALHSTTDWRTFSDEGAVLTAHISLRGTRSLESPVVFERNGIWHVFYTYGPGTYHAISRTPIRFDDALLKAGKYLTGSYFLGTFHAAEIFACDGDWWLSSDRKEEARRSNREAGRLVFHGTYGDEQATEEGLWLAHMRWDGDQPILEKPSRP